MRLFANSLPVENERHCAHHGGLEHGGVALVALPDLGGHVRHCVRGRVANLEKKEKEKRLKPAASRI